MLPVDGFAAMVGVGLTHRGGGSDPPELPAADLVSNERKPHAVRGRPTGVRWLTALSAIGLCGACSSAAPDAASIPPTSTTATVATSTTSTTLAATSTSPTK